MKFKPIPIMSEGFFQQDAINSTNGLVGQMFPQPKVQLPDLSITLLDELLGHNFSLIIFSKNSHLSTFSGLVSMCKDFGIKVVGLTPVDFNPQVADWVVARDTSNSKVLHRSAQSCFLLRPDRYVAAQSALNHGVDIIEWLVKKGYCNTM